MNQHLESGEFIVQSYNLLGYHAVNLGGNDFLGGREFLQELKPLAKFSFVSANVIDDQTHALMFAPYKILRVNKKRIGIIGITSKPQYVAEGLEFNDPKAALEKYLPELKKQTDYIVVLAALNQKDEARLMEANLSVDFMLMSATFRYSRNLEPINGIPVARVGYIGKYIGFIKATIDQPDKPLEDISKIRFQLKYVAERLQSFTNEAKGKSFEEFYKDKQSILDIIKNLQQHEQELKRQESLVVNPIEFELIPLDDAVQDEPAMRQKVNSFVERMKGLGFTIEPTH
ncbi:MAG: hypothetical protein COT43_11815 [Candidatus Marinimicrobia bacterium CG08_land_8_20_14_0_20_45_22]|nr:MAG: hypothetical protein COT43_11815 [Candidatus Marinimicrobia bacterium CG08_land_8_20_14_0_20_45_22]